MFMYLKIKHLCSPFTTATYIPIFSIWGYAIKCIIHNLKQIYLEAYAFSIISIIFKHTDLSQKSWNHPNVQYTFNTHTHASTTYSIYFFSYCYCLPYTLIKTTLEIDQIIISNLLFLTVCQKNSLQTWINLFKVILQLFAVSQESSIRTPIDWK